MFILATVSSTSTASTESTTVDDVIVTDSGFGMTVQMVLQIWRNVVRSPSLPQLSQTVALGMTVQVAPKYGTLSYDHLHSHN